MNTCDYEAALDRLQQRFNEVWDQHQQMLLALENARDVVHRAPCPAPGSFPKKCWKECEEAEDAMLEAGWMPEESASPPGPDPDEAYDRMRDQKMLGIDVPDGVTE